MNKLTIFAIHDLLKRLTLVLLLLSLTLFMACTFQGDGRIEPTAPPIAKTETTLGIGTASPTVLGTPTLPQPSATPTETATPLPTPTFTTEEMHQRWQTIDGRIETIMASNNGCQLPCWWGIELGDSIDEARQILEVIDENGWVDSPFQWGELEGIGYFDHFYRDEEGEIIYAGFLVNLRVQDGQIAGFDIYAGRSVDFDVDTDGYQQVGERLTRDWAPFSIQNIFAELGTPDLIYIMPRNPSYIVNLYYPKLGIAISYNPRPSLNEQGEDVICLNTLDIFDIMSIQLFLYDPVTELPLEYIRSTYPLWPLAPQAVPEDKELVLRSELENQTGMTIEEFMVFVLENQETDVCLDIQ